jgi:16S rRNA (cytosine967-C5)-methyltransferase
MAGRSPLPPSRTTDPRQAAFTVLVSLERTQAMADELLDQYLEHSTFDNRDRALLMELVYGVLRHRLTLDWRIDRVAAKPVERLPTPIRTILRLGAYQLHGLTKVPAHAAIDTSVTFAKRVRRGQGAHWGGFVNAVLRTLSRETPPHWPDPKDDPRLVLSVRYSCPTWLVGRWIDAHGIAEAEQLCAQTLEIPPLTIRANRLRITRPQLADSLRQAGREARLSEISPVGLVLAKQGPITEIPGYAEGWFYVEDEAAQLIPLILDPQPGERVLDACAAPGGKTTHLAALMQNCGSLVAVDRDPVRLNKVRANCRRLGISIVDTIEADLTVTPPPSGSCRALQAPFDRVLVDAPCSALGVLRRHPEAKWRKTDTLMSTAQQTQSAIIEQAARLLRPGGVMVYSTCSTESEENERVVDRFCEARPEFSREPVTPWLPPNSAALVTARGEYSTRLNRVSMDGFFASRLRKASG